MASNHGGMHAVNTAVWALSLVVSVCVQCGDWTHGWGRWGQTSSPQ